MFKLYISVQSCTSKLLPKTALQSNGPHPIFHRFIEQVVFLFRPGQVISQRNSFYLWSQDITNAIRLFHCKYFVNYKTPISHVDKTSRDDTFLRIQSFLLHKNLSNFWYNALLPDDNYIDILFKKKDATKFFFTSLSLLRP